jgi:transposase-like protein
MCMKPQAGEKVVPIYCRPKTYPCPTCGRRGRRKRLKERFVRSLAYGQVAWLRVFYARYTARCDCSTSFSSWVPNCCPRAEYDDLVRQAVLNRILDDGLNVQRTIACMKRDFLLDLSSGFIYDCLNWGLSKLNQPEQRRLALQHFSGVLCIDELHLGEFTLLLATDPIADRLVGHRLVKINDQPHMRCFLRTLHYWGFAPKVVVTDGSNLYPALLKEIWPNAKHQLCVFHVLQDINNKILAAVRRLQRAQKRRGNGGRKRRRGRLTEKQKRRARRRGPTNKDKAAFVHKHRFLIVKRTENLTKRDWEKLVTMFGYLPELRELWHFSREVYQLFSSEQVLRLARRRRTLLLKQASYQEVPELVKAMGLLEEQKFDKMVTFLKDTQVSGAAVRTNNHVERANRKLRYDEKVRYKFRSQRSLDRFLRLRLAFLAQQTLQTQTAIDPDIGRTAPTEAVGPPPE